MLSVVSLQHVESGERQNAVLTLVNSVERGVLVDLMFALDVLAQAVLLVKQLPAGRALDEHLMITIFLSPQLLVLFDLSGHFD